MAISTTTSASFSELLEYVQFAFPEQSDELKKKNELDSFIEKWEQEYRLVYARLASNVSSFYLTDEEKTYTCTCKAMCNIYNSISSILAPVRA